MAWFSRAWSRVTFVGTARWFLRYAASLACLTGWLSFSLLGMAMLIPPAENSRIVNQFGAHFQGMNTDFPLHVLLGVITVTYYLALVPTLLLPLDDEQRFSWFVHTAFGWIGCLFGSMAFLWWRGMLMASEILVPWSARVGAGLLAITFLVPMVAVMFYALPSRRRFLLCAGLFGAFVFFEALHFALARFPPGEWFAGHAGVCQLVLLLLAGLVGVFVMALSLPRGDDRRPWILGVLFLAWLFAVAALVCYQLAHRRLWTEGGDGWEVFLCLVVSVLIAPVVSFLGMPGQRESRRGWYVCLILATVTILGIVTSTRITGEQGGVLRHVWENYDGPHFRFYRAFDFQDE